MRGYSQCSTGLVRVCRVHTKRYFKVHTQQSIAASSDAHLQFPFPVQSLLFSLFSYKFVNASQISCGSKGFHIHLLLRRFLFHHVSATHVPFLNRISIVLLPFRGPQIVMEPSRYTNGHCSIPKYLDFPSLEHGALGADLKPALNR